MLKKAVPYYPVFMRPAQRMSHHLYSVSKNPHVLTYGNEAKHYGR